MNLEISPIRKEELSWLMQDEANKEGWLYSEDDVNFYFNYSGNQISAIKINGELAGCVLLHSSLGHMQGMPIRSAGFFLVIEKFRGQKIVGPHLWQHTITASINKSMLVCFHSVPRAVSFYEQLGFLKTPLINIFFALDVNQINHDQLKTIIPLMQEGSLKTIKATHLKDIETYNKKLFTETSGAGFRDFIHHWLQRPDAIIFAYYDQGIVKGYGVLTVCKKIDQDDTITLCYRLSPLYADSVEIAGFILKALVAFALQEHAQRIELSSLAESGTEFAQLLAQIGFTVCGKNYVVCNHSDMIDTNASILNKVFSGLPLEYPHEVIGGTDLLRTA